MGFGSRRKRIEKLAKCFDSLTDGQLFWLERVVYVFKSHRKYELLSSGLFDKNTLENFGDALRIHHSFSAEPFTKDKFEYLLEKVLNISGHSASLAPKGNRGHDITIDGCAVSLKTQADISIKKEKIWISKFMELGKGHWGDNPNDLIGLRNLFLDHLKNYERILILRTLSRGPEWVYELVEIPKCLLESSATGVLEMKKDSTQNPKPGYCYVRSSEGEDIYKLYFDGGSERKLQIKDLLKSYCIVLATWDFMIPPE